MLGSEGFPIKVVFKDSNISNQAKIIKLGFQGERDFFERTKVLEVVRVWEESLTTDWVRVLRLRSVLVEGH